MFIPPEMLQSVKSSLVQELREMMLTLLNSEILDPVFVLYQDAARESADFIKKHMQTALVLRGSNPTWRLWPYVLSKAKLDGCFLEFGVFKGSSISFFAKQRPECTFFGFDSFLGNPEDWGGGSAPKGYYNLDGEEPSTLGLPNVKLIKGWFEETLPVFVEQQLQREQKCSFVHMDSNLYTSSKYVAQTLIPLLTTGTVILYDDFLNYPGYAMHEFKAFFEVLDPIFEYEFIAFQGMKAALIIK